jgi:glycosyltransferase involved in cell wall biosynthesis
MAERPLRILQVGTVEAGGGAASVANRLMRAYRARGYQAQLAVGHKSTRDPEVFVIPDDDRAMCRWIGYTTLQARLRRLASRFPGRGWGVISRSLRLLTHPGAFVDQHRGREDFQFPGTYGLFDLTPGLPDIVHCHNLHGGYFDLRALAWLSRRVPTVLTLHDAWLLSGHCAHSFDCERWKTGCGECPDLTIYPAISRDATAENWRRKREIYSKSHLHVATPSRWLMRKVEESMLACAMAGARVIPHGVDRSIFRPADRRSARAALGIPRDVQVVLLTADGVQGGTFTDHQTLRAAVDLIARRLPDTFFMALGTAAATVEIGRAAVRFAGYQRDPHAVARYHQAADVYVRAARVDTFPNMVLEALACGTPVVASAVGGIPEQICTAELGELRSGIAGRLEATGVLVPSGDAGAMADAVLALLTNDSTRHRLGDNAVKDVRERFDLERQVDAYLDWYRMIIEDWHATNSGLAGSPDDVDPSCAA